MYAGSITESANARTPQEQGTRSGRMSTRRRGLNVRRSAGRRPGTTYPTPGTTREAPGKAREAPGKAREAPGKAREASGTTREASGTICEASGTTCQASGTTCEASGTRSWACCTTRETSGTMREMYLPVPQVNLASTLQSSTGYAILCATVRSGDVSNALLAPNWLDAVWCHLSGSPCSWATHARARDVSVALRQVEARQIARGPERAVRKQLA